MTRLEDRYRRLLRLLPAWYRAHREQEMVDVFLTDREAHERDSGELDAEYGWPGWGEAASVAGLAVRTRVGGPGDPPGPRTTGNVLRAVAVGAVLLCAGGAAASAFWWLAAAVIDPTASRSNLLALVHPRGGAGWWSTTSVVLELCWLPAWTALAAGQRRVAWSLGVVALVPQTVAGVRNLVVGAPTVTALAVAGSLVGLLAVVLVPLAFHRDAPPPAIRREWSLLAAATVSALGAGAVALYAQVQLHTEVAAIAIGVVAVLLAGGRSTVSRALAVLAATCVAAGLVELVVLDTLRAGPAITTTLGAVALLGALVAARRPVAPTPG